MPLLLEIVTPENRVFSDTIDSVVLPTVEGEVGILPGHIPLVTQLNPGELRVSRNAKTDYLAVGRGFAQIEGDKVSVLAESAISEEQIDEAATETAIARAQEALSGKEDLDPAEVERLESLVRFSVVKLDLKRRRR